MRLSFHVSKITTSYAWNTGKNKSPLQWPKLGRIQQSRRVPFLVMHLVWLFHERGGVVNPFSVASLSFSLFLSLTASSFSVFLIACHSAFSFSTPSRHRPTHSILNKRLFWQFCLPASSPRTSNAESNWTWNCWCRGQISPFFPLSHVSRL